MWGGTDLQNDGPTVGQFDAPDAAEASAGEGFGVDNRCGVAERGRGRGEHVPTIHVPLRRAAHAHSMIETGRARIRLSPRDARRTTDAECGRVCSCRLIGFVRSE
jgi:hypothetical protein